MKMAVFWVVGPCSLVEVYRRFRGACCLHNEGNELLIALMMATASTSETSVNFHQTTQRNNPEDSHLHLLSYLYPKTFRLKICKNTILPVVLYESKASVSHPKGRKY
jgi:hypothetical protein